MLTILTYHIGPLAQKEPTATNRCLSATRFAYRKMTAIYIRWMGLHASLWVPWPHLDWIPVNELSLLPLQLIVDQVSSLKSWI